MHERLKITFGVIIPVDKNKPKSERFFGTIYLKIVCSISSKSIWKYLLFDITLKKSILFVSNSLKMLMLSSIWNLKKSLLVSIGLCVLQKICIVGW